MPKELLEILNKINTKKVEAKALLADKKLDEAQALTEEIKNLQKEFDIAAALYEETKNQIPNTPSGGENVDLVKGFLNVLRGKQVSSEVMAALTTGVGADGGLLVPQDINTRINELKRQYLAAKDCCTNVYSTSTKSGTFVWEDLSTLTNLVDMTEMNEIDQSSQPKFRSVPYAVKEMGAVLPISNVLLQDEDANLIEYIGRWFAKKAIRTENTKIFAALKTGKTAKVLADWKALKKSVNKDLDPILKDNAYFCTNQDGFDYLDSALDGFGRPVLQPNPQNPTQQLFMGKPIYVFSNVELPTTGTTTKKAPIFYGVMSEGVTFVDRGIYEMKASSEAGFTKNATYIRVIERFDVVQADTDAYVYGEFDVTAS